MAKKTNRKLALKKETLRSLNERDLNVVAGGLASGLYCTAGQNSGGGCGSQTVSCDACILDRAGNVVFNP